LSGNLKSEIGVAYEVGGECTCGASDFRKVYPSLEPPAHAANCKTLRRVEAVKYDDGKSRWELLPFDALDDVAKVLTYGAKKYDEHNWAKGMKWSRLLGAAMRHLTAWALGERLDPESGLPHLAHSVANVLFLSASERRGIGEDDRGPSCQSKDHPKP